MFSQRSEIQLSMIRGSGEVPESILFVIAEVSNNLLYRFRCDSPEKNLNIFRYKQGQGRNPGRINRPARNMLRFLLSIFRFEILTGTGRTASLVRPEIC